MLMRLGVNIFLRISVMKIVYRNKTSLVAQRDSNWGDWLWRDIYPCNRLESFRLLLVVTCSLKFKLYQMDMKSAFLNENLEEKVYVEQPKAKIITFLIVCIDWKKPFKK